MRRLHTHRRFLAVGAAGLLAAGLAACSSSGSSSGATNTNTGAATTGKQLVMESSPESTITQSFNPFVPTGAPWGMGATGLIYEPLIQFNLVAPPKYYPWLATSYAWSNGGKTLTFAIRQGVKWNDGQPFTPADVVFTFNMLKANAAVNLNGVKYDSVTASGNNVVLNFATPQFTNLQSIAGTAMVPEHIWKSVSNPATFADPSPVGTGPMKLGSFTPQGFALVKNPSYWQASQVQVPKVFFPVYTSNTSALSALYSGQIDWTGNYIPGLQHSFVDTNPDLPPPLGGARRDQQPGAEPEQVADQPAAGAAGDQRRDQPRAAGLRGRVRPGEPGPERHRPDPAAVRRVERSCRQHDRAPPRATRPPRRRSCRRPVTPRDRTASSPRAARRSRSRSRTRRLTPTTPRSTPSSHRS